MSNLQIDEAVCSALNYEVLRTRFGPRPDIRFPFVLVWQEAGMTRLYRYDEPGGPKMPFAPSTVTDDALFAARAFCRAHSLKWSLAENTLIDSLFCNIFKPQDWSVVEYGETAAMAVCRAILAASEKMEGRDTKR